jgi:LSD1 subclass zinc finger protein
MPNVIKLACQSCHANLEVASGTEVVHCQYCGTQNHIQIRPPEPEVQVHVVHHVPAPTHVHRRGGSKWGLLGVLLPVVMGLGITAYTMDRSGQLDLGALTRGNSPLGTGTGTGATGFNVQSARPFIVDANGDGTDDYVFLITKPLADSSIHLSAYSGTDHTELWQTASLGTMQSISGQPAVYMAPDAALVSIGASVTAYGLANGTRRWTGNLPDRPKRFAWRGETLVVETVDETASAIDLAQGKVTKTQPDAGDRAARSDAGYDLIVSDAELDLASDQFPELRVQQAFCPTEARKGPEECDYPRGLAYATRVKGSAVPFLIGYTRPDLESHWQEQLTPPGSIQTLDTGFNQLRAEIMGERAVVSYQVSGQTPHLRMLNLADGATVWDVDLDLGDRGPGYINGVVQSESRILVQTWVSVHVLDAQGTRIATLGGW